MEIDYIMSIKDIKKTVDHYYNMIIEAHDKSSDGDYLYVNGFIRGIKYATSVLKLNMLNSLHHLNMSDEDWGKIADKYRDILNKIKRIEKIGEIKHFPRDCRDDCEFYRAWDINIDDLTCVCMKLNRQIDLCDCGRSYEECPLGKLQLDWSDANE